MCYSLVKTSLQEPFAFNFQTVQELEIFCHEKLCAAKILSICLVVISTWTKILNIAIVVLYFKSHQGNKLFLRKDNNNYYCMIFFFIQFNVPFKIISLIETSQWVGWRNGSTPGKPPDTPASRTWLVSHVASAGLEPTPDTAVR